MKKKNTNTMRIHWQTVTIDSVLQHYVKGFKAKTGDVIHSADYFVDVAKGQIAFRLFIDSSKRPKNYDKP